MRGEEVELALMSIVKLLPTCREAGVAVLPAWLCTCSPKASPASTSSSTGLRLAKTDVLPGTVLPVAQAGCTAAVSATAVAALASSVTSP